MMKLFRFLISVAVESISNIPASRWSYSVISVSGRQCRHSLMSGASAVSTILSRGPSDSAGSCSFVRRSDQMCEFIAKNTGKYWYLRIFSDSRGWIVSSWVRGTTSGLKMLSAKRTSLWKLVSWNDLNYGPCMMTNFFLTTMIVMLHTHWF